MANRRAGEPRMKKGPCGPLIAAIRLRGLLFDRTGVLALGIDVAIDELDHRERRAVAIAEARLHDAGIAAVALLVARADHVEQLLDHRDVADLGDRLAPCVQVAALAEGDQLLDDRTQVLGLGQRRGDLLMLYQRRAHVCEHRPTMLGRAVELAMGVTVTHRRDPFSTLFHRHARESGHPRLASHARRREWPGQAWP